MLIEKSWMHFFLFFLKKEGQEHVWSSTFAYLKSASWILKWPAFADTASASRKFALSVSKKQTNKKQKQKQKTEEEEKAVVWL